MMAMKRAKDIAMMALVLAFVLLFVWGCASAAVIEAGAEYQAFGDFITAGATLTNPVKEAYPSLVAGEERVSYTNRAAAPDSDMDQACDLAPRQIFAQAATGNPSSRATYSVLIGTNDVDVRGAGDGADAYQPIFRECHLAALSWLAVPAAEKVIVGGGGGVIANGPGAMDWASGWPEYTTAGQGSTVTFPVTTAKAGALYAWLVIDDGSAATYTYDLDGAIAGPFSVRLGTNIATHNGTTRTLGLLRLQDVPAGQHTLTFTQINSGKDGVSVVAVGVPGAASGVALPTVLAGTIPFQQKTGASTGCQASDAPCQAYNAEIAADVSLLAGDGLDVRLFDTRKYMQGTAEEMSDAVHPNVLGQKELSEAVKAVWQAGN